MKSDDALSFQIKMGYCQLVLSKIHISMQSSLATKAVCPFQQKLQLNWQSFPTESILHFHQKYQDLNEKKFHMVILFFVLYAVE